jgi:hypothetical protein
VALRELHSSLVASVCTLEKRAALPSAELNDQLDAVTSTLLGSVDACNNIANGLEALDVDPPLSDEEADSLSWDDVGDVAQALALLCKSNLSDRMTTEMCGPLIRKITAMGRALVGADR